MSVIDTCERGSTLHWTTNIWCAILPKNCQLFVKTILMASDDKILLGFFGNVFSSPTIITCFHSGHATSWSVIAGIPHFLRNLQWNCFVWLRPLLFKVYQAFTFLRKAKHFAKSAFTQHLRGKIFTVWIPHTLTHKHFEGLNTIGILLSIGIDCLLAWHVCVSSFSFFVQQTWNILEKVWESGAAWRQGTWPGKGKVINFSAKWFLQCWAFFFSLFEKSVFHCSDIFLFVQCTEYKVSCHGSYPLFQSGSRGKILGIFELYYSILCFSQHGMTRFQLILPVHSQNPPNFKVVI